MIVSRWACYNHLRFRVLLNEIAGKRVKQCEEVAWSLSFLKKRYVFHWLAVKPNILFECSQVSSFYLREICFGH